VVVWKEKAGKDEESDGAVQKFEDMSDDDTAKYCYDFWQST